MGKVCGYCGQGMSAELIANRKLQRSENVRRGLLKAQADGTHIGRPLKVNQERIKKLRASGMSLRTIAKKEKCSLGSVAYALGAK